MEAKDTVMPERGSEYDDECGQEIACDILPKYISGELLETCYLEVSRAIERFVELERQAQADISFQAGRNDVVEWIIHNSVDLNQYWSSLLYPSFRIDTAEWRAQVKSWGIVLPLIPRE